MALINCPECNKEISNKAHSCPNCGFPIAIRSSVHVGTERPIELTSKRFKLITLISISIMIIGIVWLLLPIFLFGTHHGFRVLKYNPYAVIVIFIGLISYIANRIRIWWHHK